MGNVNEAVDNASQGVDPSIPSDTNVAAGLSPDAPQSIAALNELKRTRGMDVFRGSVLGAGAGASVPGTNPLTAFLQGAAVGMQAPMQIYAQKQASIQGAVDAMPFGVTHADLIKNSPGYQAYAGLPTRMALDMIKVVAVDAAKIAAQGASDIEKAKEAKKLEYPTSPEQINAFVASTGLPADMIPGMRISALEEYSKSKAAAPEKQREKLEKTKTMFNNMPAVKTWDTIKPNVSTVGALAGKLNSAGNLTPQEQAQLMIAFKDIATLGGGAARMTEDTLNIVENKGRWGQLVDAITSGAAVSLTPAEARDVVNAANYKINAVKSGYLDEKAKFRDILLKDDKTTQDFIFDDKVDSPSQNMGALTQPKPGTLISEEIDGEIIVYKINPDGKTKKRVK